MHVSAAILLAFCYSAIATPLATPPASTTTTHLERRAPEPHYPSHVHYDVHHHDRYNRYDRHYLERRAVPAEGAAESKTAAKLERRAPEPHYPSHVHYDVHHHDRYNRYDRHYLERRAVPAEGAAEGKAAAKLERRAPRPHSHSSERGRRYFNRYSGYHNDFHGDIHNRHWLQRRALSSDAASGRKLERRGYSSTRYGRRYDSSRHGRWNSSRRGHGWNGNHWLQRRALSADATPAHKLERRSYSSNRYNHGNWNSSRRGRWNSSRRGHGWSGNHWLQRRAVWGHAPGDADDQFHDNLARQGRMPGHFPNDLDDQIKHGRTTFNPPTTGVWGGHNSNWNNWNRRGHNSNWGDDHDSDGYDSHDEKGADKDDIESAGRTPEAKEDTASAAPKPKHKLERRDIHSRFGDFHNNNFHHDWYEAAEKDEAANVEEPTKAKAKTANIKVASSATDGVKLGGGAASRLVRRGYESHHSDDDSDYGSDHGYGSSGHGRRYPHRRYHSVRRVVHYPVHHHHNGY